ncbi:MAG: metalloregulator ArsR/SmtB family transcription factor [Acidimicrobiales bacterium]|jgi:ArsR family transcriptional regulator
MSNSKLTLIDDAVLRCCSPLAGGALSEAEADDMAQIFAALSDPVRLRMLSLIATEDEVCSCNLEEPLAKSQPTISHHTRILVEAGLITGEKRGRWVWWHLVPERLQQVARILGD